MRILIVIIYVLLQTATSFGQKEIAVVDFEGLEPYLNRENDTTYVVNFWATWCKPCVKELPAFEKINDEYANDKVKVLLVSLDFIKHFESRLIPFVNDREIKSEVILLNDPRSNRWINRVSEEWSGAIPATLIYRGKDRSFYERSFTYQELEDEVLKKLNP